jgi:hypothetical protein
MIRKTLSIIHVRGDGRTIHTIYGDQSAVRGVGWFILLCIYVFLKSWELDPTAYTLEHEAWLRLNLCQVVTMISEGRWRVTDK